MKILVTGGGGFLGQALCRGLVERGHDVTSFNRGHYPALDLLGVRQVQGDLADRDAVLAAFAGSDAAGFDAAGFDAVFHNAAKAGAWGRYDSYHRANVVGTQNVIDACRARSARRGTSCWSPGPQIRRGRSAMVASEASFAASTACSAMVLVVA